MKLAEGGQGVVFTAPDCRMSFAKSLVYKEYKAVVRPGLNVAVLDEMPAYLESLPFADGMDLLTRAAWPCRLVEEDTSTTVTGFVMPVIPDEFFIKMMLPSGTKSKPAEFQHLLNGDRFLARLGIPLTERDRYELLLATAQALTILHSHHIAVGDMSPKNLLFSLHPERKVYFIDCDAMRFQSRSVAKQVETPDWEVRQINPGEELATAQSDAYKLGLLALRLLVSDQSTRDPGRLPSKVPAAVRQLVRAALSSAPATRPTPADWVPALTAAARIATSTAPKNQKSTRPVNFSSARPLNFAPGPPAPTATPRAATVPVRQTRPARGLLDRPGVKVGAVAAVLLVVLAIFLINKTSGGNSASPTVQRGAVATAPATAVIATVGIGAQPWGVAVDPNASTAYATNSVSNSLSAVDTRTTDFGVTTVSPAGTAKPAAIAIDPAAGIAYATNAGSASVSLINTRTHAVVGSIPVGAGPYGVAVDTASHAAYVSDFDADTVSVIDTSTRMVTATIPVGRHPYGVAVDPATRSVYVVNAGSPDAVDHTVSVIDTGALTVVATINVGNQPWGVAIDTDAGTAYITNHADGTVSVINTRSRTVVTTIRVGVGPVGVAVDSRARSVYVANHGLDDIRSDNTVSVIDSGTAAVSGTVRVGTRPHGIAVDAADHLVYVTNFNDGTLSVIGH
ncbi:hypothetical protein ACIBCN_01680 [Nocardia sp. NPDC051052]|uniref:hypothetical protein n=1 Tax=Nocardia sp. NPDC051052 TaxID=3364322 RepID=UPI003795EAC2